MANGATATKADPKANAPKVDPKTAAAEALKKGEAGVATNAAAPPRAKRPPVESWEAIFGSPEAAVEEAKRRAQGPRRAFTLTLPEDVKAGTYHIVGHQQLEAFGLLAVKKFKASWSEIGKPAREARTPATPEETIAKVGENLSDATPERKKALLQAAMDLVKKLGG